MSFSGVYLCSHSREKLSAWWTHEVGPLLPSRYMDHMTIKFQPSSEELKTFPNESIVTMQVIGFAQDSYAQAVAVKCVRCPSLNEVPHITVATNGTRPKYSNTLLAKGWNPVENGPLLFGQVECPHRELIISEGYSAVAAIDRALEVPEEHFMKGDNLKGLSLANKSKKLNEVCHLPVFRSSPEELLVQLLEKLPPSDFTLKIGGKEFKLHRFVLSYCSDYFRNLCGDHFIIECTNETEKDDAFLRCTFEIIFLFYASLGLVGDFSFHLTVLDVPLMLQLRSEWKLTKELGDCIFSFIINLIEAESDLKLFFTFSEQLSVLLNEKELQLFESSVCSKIERTVRVTSDIIPWEWVQKIFRKTINSLTYNYYLQKLLKLEKNLTKELKTEFPNPSFRSLQIQTTSQETSNTENFSAEENDLKIKNISLKWAPILQKAILDRNAAYQKCGKADGEGKSRIVPWFLSLARRWPEESVKQIFQENDWILMRECLINLSGELIENTLFPLLHSLSLRFPSKLLVEAFLERSPKELRGNFYPYVEDNELTIHANPNDDIFDGYGDDFAGDYEY
jgi:hypothetical protein